MRAVAVFPKERAVRLIDHPDPRIESPTQVKVRMLEVGVCGTDREIVTFQYGAPPPRDPYLILGHESLGQVIDVGEKVTRVAPGDLVVLMVRRPCPHGYCVSCRAGRQDFCYTGDYTERGIKQRHGFMCDYVVDDEKYLHVAPPELRDIAVLTEPLTIAEKSLHQVWDVQERLPWACPVDPAHPDKSPVHCRRAVVLGAGPVGLLGAMLLRKSGFETWVYSRESAAEAEAKLVADIGGHYLSSEDVTVDELNERLGSIDLVYEATGASKLSFDVLAELGVNGIFIFTGVPGRREPAEIPTGDIMRNMVLKNQLLLGSVNAGPQAFSDAIADLGEFKRLWPEVPPLLITQRFVMEDFETALLHPPAGIKKVVSIWGEE